MLGEDGMGGREGSSRGRGHMYAYVYYTYVYHVGVWQKVTQYCKSNYPPIKNKFKKKS